MTVTVEAINGELVAKVTNNAVLTNTYYGEPESFSTKDEGFATKIVTGTGFGKQTFNFTITPVDGAPAPTKPNASVEMSEAGSQAIDFGTVTFAREGKYQYKVRETGTAPNGWTFDTEEKTVTVEVSRADPCDGGGLRLDVTGAEITNSYAATDEVIVTISGVEDWVMYDGNQYTISGFIATSNNTEYSKNINDNAHSNFSYEFDGVLNGEVVVAGTNVGNYTLDLSAHMKNFKNLNPNFPNVKFVFKAGKESNILHITPRTVTLTSGSDEKVYDGKALTNETVTVTGDGFVGNEGATYTFTGSQTEEGSSQNTFTYTLTGGAQARNYNVNVNYGTLTVTTAEIIEEPEPPKAPPEEIEDDETPLAGPTWALINLIATILTVLTAAGMVITYFKKKDEDEEENEDGAVRQLTDEEKQAEEEENERKKSKFLGLIPGIGSVITFLLTEDMRNPMVLVDRWTILMIAILVIGAAMAYLTRNKDEEEEEEKPEEA